MEKQGQAVHDSDADVNGMAATAFGGRKAIILCEADPVAARLIEAQLRNAGYEVLTCHSAADCESLVDRHPPDILVLTALLPDGDGFSLARRVRDRVRAIVMVSALRAADRAREFGIDCFLSKPLKANMLVGSIDHLLRPAA